MPIKSLATKNHYKPKVLMSIHGYYSIGEWQDKLSLCLQDYNIKGFPYKYGKKIFRVLRFHIEKDIQKFSDWYFSIVDNPNNNLKIEEPFHRPSIIAHSLGTWLLVKTLDKYPEIKFDKLYLVGSIVPVDFDWFKLILRGQVNTVIYEKAERDKIVPLGLIFTGSLKPSGTRGFIQESSFIKQETYSEFGHSDFNYKAHFKTFIEKRLNEQPHQLIIRQGRELSEQQVRVFFKDSGKIDISTYSNDYTDNQITMSEALEWFRIEKDIWSFVQNVYTEAIIGYINAIPVTDEFYNGFCSGQILEKDITANDILPYDTSKEYNLIVLSIAIKKSVDDEETMLHKGRIAEMLIMSFIYKIKQHNKGGKKLKKLAAFAWTPAGKRLCEGFCMTKTESSKSNYPLYEVEFSKLNNKKIAHSNFMSKWWYKKILRLS